MNFFEVKKAKRRKTKITGLEKVVNSTDVMNHKALKTSNFVECNTDADVSVLNLSVLYVYCTCLWFNTHICVILIYK